VGETIVSDVGGGSMTITCEWEFHLSETGGPQALQAKGDRVMSSLLDLESADPRLADSAVSLDAGIGIMTIGLVVSGIDYEETVAHALTSITAAVHAAGVSIPDGDAGASPLEPQGFTAAAV